MKSTFLNQLFTDAPLVSLGLILFFITFCGTLAWVFARKGAKETYERISLIPLEEDCRE